MMRLRQIRAAAGALGNQLGAGIPVSEATRRLVRFQPAYADFWNDVADNCAAGHQLSEYLGTVWPEALVNSIKAGEEGSTLPAVFAKIDETVELQMRIQGLVMKIGYPAGLGVAGLGVFVFFMVEVLPTLAKSLGSGDLGNSGRGFVFQLSTGMASIFYSYWLPISVVIAASAAGVVSWLRAPVNRDRILTALLAVPVIGEALRNLYFGLWAHYMALTYAAGIPVIRGLAISGESLPAPLREGVSLMALDVTARGLADASDPEKQAEGDPRRDWPFYISNAFIVAQNTGRVDAELMRVAPAMIKDGMASLNLALSIINVVVMAISALLIVAPLMAYYAQLGSALQAAMR